MNNLESDYYGYDQGHSGNWSGSWGADSLNCLEIGTKEENLAKEDGDYDSEYEDGLEHYTSTTQSFAEVSWAKELLEESTEGREVLRDYARRHADRLHPDLLGDDIDCSADFAHTLIETCEQEQAKAAAAPKSLEERIDKEVSLGEWQVPVRVGKLRRLNPRKGHTIVYPRDEINEVVENSSSASAWEVCIFFIFTVRVRLSK